MAPLLVCYSNIRELERLLLFEFSPTASTIVVGYGMD